MLINVWRFLALLFFFNSEYCILFSIQNLQNMSSQSNIQMHTIYYSDILEVLAIRAKFVNCYDFFQKNMASRKLPENYQSPHNSSSLTQNLPHPFLTISGFFFLKLSGVTPSPKLFENVRFTFSWNQSFLDIAKCLMFFSFINQNQVNVYSLILTKYPRSETIALQANCTLTIHSVKQCNTKTYFERGFLGVTTVNKCEIKRDN